MKSTIIYASHSGNTRQIAEAMAAGLRPRGPVQLCSVEEAPRTLAAGTDLVVIGGPTEGHGMTKDVAAYFDQIEPHALDGMTVAAFDTRLRWPRWISGSAASGIAKRQRRAGARAVLTKESFFVRKNAGELHLEPGEVERARAWATSLADTLEPVVFGKAS